VITLTLPYPISANRYWTAVTIGGKNMAKRQIMVASKEAKAYKEQCGWIAKAAGLSKPLDWRFAMAIDLYPALPQDWQRRARADLYWDDDVRCMDLGNCEKVLADALQGIVYTDDRWIWREEKNRMAPDHKGARVEVRITPFVRQSGTSPVQPALELA
jgi:crossover junction endodeoxyribonuclease RusA